MRIENCYFCSRPCYPSKGITFVRNDAKVFRFCRSKCHKNFKMKRNPRKLSWTKSFRAAHGKEMTVDSTLTFAARRNAPVRYNRDLVAKTIGAMSVVSAIRARRERQHYIRRMRGNKVRTLAEDRELVAKAQHLLPPALRDSAIAKAKKRVAMADDAMVDDDDDDWAGVDVEAEAEAEAAAEEEKITKKKRSAARSSKQAATNKIRVDTMDVDM